MIFFQPNFHRMCALVLSFDTVIPYWLLNWDYKAFFCIDYPITNLTMGAKVMWCFVFFFWPDLFLRMCTQVQVTLWKGYVQFTLWWHIFLYVSSITLLIKFFKTLFILVLFYSNLATLCDDQKIYCFSSVWAIFRQFRVWQKNYSGEKNSYVAKRKSVTNIKLKVLKY